jgi:hypothetical protein
MSRPFLDPAKKRRVSTTVSLFDGMPVTLQQRGGSAYLRLVLSTPVPVEHRVAKRVKAAGK